MKALHILQTLVLLSAHDERRVAVCSISHPRTVRRAYRGDEIRSTSRARIVAAATELGLPLPPPEACS